MPLTDWSLGNHALVLASGNCSGGGIFYPGAYVHRRNRSPRSRFRQAGRFFSQSRDLRRTWSDDGRRHRIRAFPRRQRDSDPTLRSEGPCGWRNALSQVPSHSEGTQRTTVSRMRGEHLGALGYVAGWTKSPQNPVRKPLPRLTMRVLQDSRSEYGCLGRAPRKGR